MHSAPGSPKPSGSSKSDGRGVSGKGAKKGEVLTVPESPTELAGHEFDDEAVAMALQEEEREAMKNMVGL